MDLPDHLQEVFDRLENIKKEIHDLAFTLLLEGELKPMPNTPVGETYPYAFELHIKDSLDPNVQSLSLLIDNIEETLKKIKVNINPPCS